MKTLALISFFALFHFALLAQDLKSPPLAPEHNNPRISQRLERITNLQNRSARASFIAENRLVTRTSDGKLNVELIRRSGNTSVKEVAQSLGLEVAGTWKNRADCYVDHTRIQAVAERVPEGFFLAAVEELVQNNQGPGLQNAQSYIDGGKDGSGITIGIIDSGYDEIVDAVNQGDVPAAFDSIDFTGNGFSSGGNEHGTACFEVAYDNAPGATYRLYRTSNGTQFGQAVNDAINNNVDIITTSLGPHNTGWDDNSGPYCQAVIDAVTDGMLVFVTAGNEARKHWQGTFEDVDDDNWHEWGSDETNDYTTLPANDPNNRDRIIAWLQWDSDESEDHYDLYLYDQNASTVLASSTESGSFETLSWSNASSSNTLVKVAIKAKTANPPEFELFVHPNSLEYQEAASSIECPANTTVANCISVGAVYRSDYTDAAGTTPITSYSSHGPTNNGNQAPDICAVTGSTTNAYEGDFNGTSCSAPNAAGAAAALWSAHPTYGASGIRQLLLRKAYLYKDWGTTGTDLIYGHGGLFLKDYTPNTIYIYRFSGNTTGTGVLPYSSIQQADQYGPSNANAFFLGYAHEQPPAGTIMDKPMIYRSVQRSSYVQ